MAQFEPYKFISKSQIYIFIKVIADDAKKDDSVLLAAASADDDNEREGMVMMEGE